MPIRKKFVGALLAGAAMVFGPSYQAQATVTTSGCAAATSCSMQELVDGGSIAINGVVFNNWATGQNFFVEATDSDDIESSMSLSSIFVGGIDETILPDPTKSTLGLSVWSDLFVLPQFFDAIIEGDMAFDFSFDSLVGGGRMMTAAELSMGNHALNSDDSFVDVHLEIDTLTPENLLLRVFDANGGSNPGSDLVDDLSFGTAVNAAAMASDLALGTFVPGGVSLDQYDMLFTIMRPDMPPVDVDEPAGAGILLGALGLFALARRKRLQKQNH